MSSNEVETQTLRKCSACKKMKFINTVTDTCPDCEWDGKYNTLSHQSKATYIRNIIVNLITHDGHKDASELDETSRKIVALIDQAITLTEQRVRKEMVTGETSDGYHTFNELYEFRKLYNAALFNEWASQGKYDVHKSKFHADGGKCFGGGWFIVMAQLPTGQISNHYEIS